MTKSRFMTKRRFLLSAAAASLFAVFACAQDSPSLGDLARQQRQQREQSKSTPANVVTNEEIPENADSTPPVTHIGPGRSPARGPKDSPERIKSQIRALENQIAVLQTRVEQLIQSIPRAPIDCANGCPHWNEAYRRKEEQLDRINAQLQDQKRQLAAMQESARKQGYGSSVYEP